MRRAAALVCACAVSSGSAWAQQPPLLQQVRSGTVDFSVPDSPAFTILDLTPQSVVRPDSPRALAAALLNGVDHRGHVQNGVAIDTAPYLLLVGDRVTLTTYRNDRVVRFLSRAQVSVATTKGTSDGDPSARVGVGVHLTLLDRGDPRTDPVFAQQLAEVGTKVLADNPQPPPDPEDTPDVRADAWRAHVEHQANALAEPLRDSQRARAWNATRWSVGVAGAFRSLSGSLGALDGDGSAAWTSFAYGFEDVPALDDAAQLMAHARVRTGERVEGENQDHVLVGVRVRAGGPNATGSFELTHLRVNHPAGDDTYLRLTAGLERRLIRSVWLQVGIGGERGNRLTPSNTFLLTEFTVAVGER